MKIPIYQIKDAFKSVHLEKIEIECSGTGVEGDPILIKPSDTLPKSFHIRNSYLYILIKNCKKNQISLEACRNITIEDCEVSNCSIFRCSNIRINKTTITSTLNSCKTSISFIENSNIHYLKLKQSSGNTIKDCTISILKNRNSENNFEGNSIPETELSKLTKISLIEFVYKWKLHVLLVFIIALYTVITILIKLLENAGFKVPIPAVIFVPFITIIMFYVPLMVSLKRQKEKDEDLI